MEVSPAIFESRHIGPSAEDQRRMLAAASAIVSAFGLRLSIRGADGSSGGDCGGGGFFGLSSRR